jgi:hypothetical protein
MLTEKDVGMMELVIQGANSLLLAHFYYVCYMLML